MAAKSESVDKCAGPLQYGVGRPDGANTMIKTMQYLAEADSSRVLDALDLKAAFQSVSRRSMLYSVEQTDADLAAIFSKWYTGTSEHRMHFDSAYTKSVPTAGWIRDALSRLVVFRRPLTLHSGQFLAEHLHDTARLRCQALSLPGRLVPVDQTNRSTYSRQSLLSQ